MSPWTKNYFKDYNKSNNMDQINSFGDIAKWKLMIINCPLTLWEG